MLSWCLKWFQGPEVPLEGTLQFRDRKLGQLVLGGKCDAAILFAVVCCHRKLLVARLLPECIPWVKKIALFGNSSRGVVDQDRRLCKPLTKRLGEAKCSDLSSHGVSFSDNLNSLCVERRDSGADVEAAESGTVEVVTVLKIIGRHHTKDIMASVWGFMGGEVIHTLQR